MKKTTAALALALGMVFAGGTAQADLLEDTVPSLELGVLECSLIEVPAATPVGTGPCPGVRPGALVETPIGFCSFNFLFAGGDGNRYIGTAATASSRETARAAGRLVLARSPAIVTGRGSASSRTPCSAARRTSPSSA